MGDLILFPRAPQPRAIEAREPSPVVEHRPLLWREALGHELRQERLAQERTQGDVATRAGISTQYLSELERGRKEPSSEILAAVTGALRLPLADLVLRAAGLIRPAILATSSVTDAAPSSRPDGPVLLAA